MSENMQIPIEVYITVPFSERALSAFSKVDPRINIHYHPVDSMQTLPKDLLHNAEILYTGEIFLDPNQSPNLRWVQLDTSGVDHVSHSWLWKSDITITTIGGVSAAPLAEWIMMMVLAHAHHLRRTEGFQAQHKWPSRTERWSELMPHNLRTSTLGIVGYGRIGHALASRAQAFGMKVIATQRNPGALRANQHGSLDEVPGVRMLPYDNVEELFALSDYIALTVPLTAQTDGLVNASVLSHARPGAVIINASRGGVVDETALMNCLEEGKIGFVMSDVFKEEPLPPDSKWWSHPNSVVTPHSAGFAPDYEDAVIELFTENLRRYIRGENLLNVADRQKGY